MSEIESKCIYFGNTKNELSYSKQEHVIPASLGGSMKLPRGVVSDQANELFSKYELKAVRNTFLSINRNNNGPGKRGSLSVKKVTSPQINLFEVVENESENSLDTKYAPVRLGFLFSGKAYMISQILFFIDKDWSIKWPRIVMDTISENTLSTINDFIFRLNDFISCNNEKYVIVNSEMKTQFRYIIIGMYNGKFYISTSLDSVYIKNFLALLKQKRLPSEIPVLPSTVATYHYSNILTDALDDSFSLVYVKIAFNVLAFFTNCNFILQNQFDHIRNAILTVTNLDSFFIEKSMPKWLIEWVNNEVKPREHFVVINAENNYIEAYVSFYREPLMHSIYLTENYTGKGFRKCFVCNWSNRTERQYEI